MEERHVGHIGASGSEASGPLFFCGPANTVHASTARALQRLPHMTKTDADRWVDFVGDDARGEEPSPEDKCGKELECGGTCFLSAGHSPPCLCVGDEDGVPNTCPA